MLLAGSVHKEKEAKKGKKMQPLHLRTVKLIYYIFVLWFKYTRINENFLSSTFLKGYNSNLCASNAFVNPDITLYRRSDIITVLFIVCSTAVGGAQQDPPTTGCLQKNSGEGRHKTSHPAHGRRGTQRKIFRQDYCTDLEKIHKAQDGCHTVA